ncbi:hypothetical protein [Solirubrobacter pauli]|uniref:hypothetical protein n=1 Tax=Solirubrobacter pauli TaxID=166793 RepID=UPI000EB234B4|nr:hypothetical protein [Solirubrobacter pauli]
MTAQTVAAAQTEATAAATAATEAARVAADAGVALDAAKAAAKAAADKAAATNDPADIAAAAAASAAQATAQQNFDAKTAASTKAAADSTAAAANAAREAASLAKVDKGTSTEGTPLPDDTAKPDVQKSDNVDYVGHARGPIAVNGSCPAYNPTGCPAFSALNFLHYENLGYDILVANGTPGLGVWSLKDPKHPEYIASVSAAQIGEKTGEALTRFWEGENMTVDSRRKIAYLSKDSGTKGIAIVDLKDPWHPKLVGFQKTQLGHTATCLNDCRFIWQVGSGVSGRRSAVAVTDIRDIEHPFTYSNVFEAAVRRTSSTSGSTHSVDVDFDGVAWVSGSGGVRGWWTEGQHKDTATGEMRYATPYDPLPYGGGSVAGATGLFMHNAYHVPQALGDQAAGDVMLITNEDNRTNCNVAGKFIIASLKGARDVENNLPAGATTTPALMPQLASYTTAGKPGEFIDPTRAIGDCSAHWFTVKGNIVALGNYEQGTRFVDISDPRNPQQVGYFRVPAKAAAGSAPAVISSNTASAIWHDQYVYVADYARGIDVLKFSAPKGTTQPKTCWNSCADNQTMGDWADASGNAGGTVPATLALTLGAPATFGTFLPGVAQEYTATTKAMVISTAGDATLTAADPSTTANGHLVNGAFSLPQPLQGLGVVKTYSGPVSNDEATVTFKQAIGAGDALRTGSYSKTLTFTLSTTNP